MQDELLAFLESPSVGTLSPLRKKLVESPDYDPYASWLTGIDNLIEAGELDHASELLGGAMANYLLSPRAHLMAAYLHREVGEDREASETEDAIATICIEGILATGNGSQDAPYLVTFISDEYDVMEYLDKASTRQSLHHNGDKHYDVLTTSDGDEIWFDITDLYNRALKSRENPAP